MQNRQGTVHKGSDCLSTVADTFSRELRVKTDLAERNSRSLGPFEAVVLIDLILEGQVD